MVYLDVDKLENINFCKLENERELNVEHGLAIAKVLVGRENSQDEETCYETYTVVKEVIDELMGGRKRYELANTFDADFKLAQYVVSIKRTGKHFIFEVRNGIHEEDTIWFDYYHYEYDEVSETFKSHGNLGGKPTLTKSEDLVIINDSRLYSLGRQANIGNKFTRIEDCDGNRFFVHDDITTTKPSSLHNHLMFDINGEGVKTSKVFSTNIGTFTDDDLNVSYDEIRDKEIGILDSKLAEEEKYKMLMKSASGYEQ